MKANRTLNFERPTSNIEFFCQRDAFQRSAFAVLVLSFTLLCLTGCVKPTVAPVTPGEGAPDTFVSMPMEEGEMLAAMDLAVWWTLFDDEALSSLVQRSLDANLNLATAAARIEEAFAERGIAAGERVPSVNGTAGLFETRLSDALGGSAGNRDFSLSSVGFDASWEIDLWGRISKMVEAADAAAQASVEDFRGVRASIASQVVVNYVSLRELQLRQKLAEENITLQKETLTLTQGRFDAGLVPKLDVDQAALNLARTEAVLPQLRQSEAETLRALEILSGTLPGALAEELAELTDVPLPASTNLRDLPANIIRRRPDLRVAEQQMLAAASRVGVAKAELYPRISLYGSFAWEARDGDDLFGGDSVGYSFGPSILMPIFQGGRLRSQVDAAEARALQAELAYRQQVLEALGEVENALTSYQEEQVRSAKLAAGVEASKSTVIQVRSLYENGLVTFLNVLDAERNLAAIQDEAAASLGQTSRNLATVYRAFGGGWDAPGFEEMPGEALEIETTILSTHSARLALTEKTDDVLQFRVVSYQAYSREEPEAVGMLAEVSFPVANLEGDVAGTLGALLPGEEVQVEWDEVNKLVGEESILLYTPFVAERISVPSK